MAKYEDVQRDFSGGEISQRMFMRDDLEVHGKALLSMENFMPTLQGTAVRTPGARFLWEIKTAADGVELGARIFPYLTPDNQYALVEILPDRGTGGDIRIRQDVSAAVSGIPASGGIDPDAPQTVFKHIVPNYDFRQSYNGWTPIDPEYTGGGGDTLGWSTGRPGRATSRVGFSSKDNDTCTITTEAVIPEDTDQIGVLRDFQYVNNFTDVTASKHSGTISIGTTPNGTEIWTEDFSGMTVGEIRDSTVPAVPVVLTAGTKIYLTFTFTALKEDGVGSAPSFFLSRFGVLSKVEVDISSVVISGEVPYSPEELQDVHYVQSPYFDSGRQDGGFGNEMVFVHPKHPPKRLYYYQGAYTFADIPFYYRTREGIPGGTPATDPVATWESGGYPATCTSYLGRLVLAGSDTNPTLGSLTGSLVERVWCTVVGKWNQFTDPDKVEIAPDDSIQFSSTYRSPIEWVHGQSNLLIGSESYEYVAAADGIFQPSDLGVFLQSTHGSAPVQPVPMGQYVLFAAEQGYRVRAMQYIAESEYWISPDVTLFHPDLFAKGGGIKRMVRMRNPHQMCVCLMGNGNLALLHQDSYAGISAWSRFIQGSRIKDIVTLPDENGTDVLYMLVERNIQGVNRLYLEAIADWEYATESKWNYTNSAVTFIPPSPTNIITGLDHLEGRRVQVVGDQRFLGTFLVESGQVTLLDGTDTAINVSSAIIGTAWTARIRTMPLVGQDPGSRKRYSSLYVRCLNSSRPIINNKRPPDRDPSRIMNESQDLDIIADYEQEILGWNRTQVIEVKENLPVRTEVIGIYGSVKSNSL